ncbi:MAG: GtrA family protein [Methanobrevibacter sp.]|jgi:putative flippase GtrA|nr:GtrA family protein [Candidatus Methanovirga aequatorialis]
MRFKELMLRYLKDGSDDLLIQFFRYIFVGGFAFLVDFGFLYLLTEYLGLFYIISATISFTIGLVVNYILSLTWVFNKRKLNNRVHEFAIFALVGVIGLGLNDIIIYCFTAILSVYYLFSKIISQVAVLLWNFLVRRYVLFK